jgi:hypothetical protein
MPHRSEGSCRSSTLHSATIPKIWNMKNPQGENRCWDFRTWLSSLESAWHFGGRPGNYEGRRRPNMNTGHQEIMPACCVNVPTAQFHVGALSSLSSRFQDVAQHLTLPHLGTSLNTLHCHISVHRSTPYTATSRYIVQHLTLPHLGTSGKNSFSTVIEMLVTDVMTKLTLSVLRKTCSL